MPRTIIIVDDEETNLRVFSRMLARQGYAVKTHTDPNEVVDRIKSGETPDLILTDYHMPQMTGGQMADDVRKWGYAGKILLLSGNLNLVTHSSAVDRYGEKPIGNARLVALVDELIGPADATSDAAPVA